MTNSNYPPASEPDENQPIRGDKEVHFSPKIVHFNDMARCGGEVWIEYMGKLYRLQSTRQGKLILTK